MNENQPNTLPPEYFERIYQQNRDPWNFAASDYERAKYRATLDALPKTNSAEKYESALEIGCSIGVLTEMLARRCNALLAVDVSEIALSQAIEHCRAETHVRFETRRIPDEFPEQTFDLILISEVGYYLALIDWQAAIEKIVAQTRSNGDIVLVHWTPFVHDYPQTGDEVHNAFSAQTQHRLTHLSNSETDKYRIDVWRKN